MIYTDSIYGEFELTGIIEELIYTPVFQRLKKIHQGGAIMLVNSEMNHTRFEHSLGVMLLIRKLGGDLEEQIAGLIHDISHTAFSHLIDYVFENEEEDYHEKRFEEVLKEETLISLLTRHGFNWRNFLELEQYPLLEYPLPGLCADRIDYTLRDLFHLKKISKTEIEWFFGGLQIHEKRIVLTEKKYGKWFQHQYAYLVDEYFSGRENVEINLIMKQIIQECLHEGILLESDFFMDDFYLLEKINHSFNLETKITHLRSMGMGTTHLKTKKRAVNPEILVNNQVIRLSDIP